MGRMLTTLSLAVLLTLALGACGPGGDLTYIPEGTSRADADLDALMASVDLGAVERAQTAEAGDLRTRALTSLRRQGDEAIALADVLTAEFPVELAAVPVYAERGEMDGEAAWFVVEAWGPTGGALTKRRLWVISVATGSVVAARSE